MSRSFPEKNSEPPDANQTHDLPDTGSNALSLSYGLMMSEVIKNGGFVPKDPHCTASLVIWYLIHCYWAVKKFP